MSDLSEEEGRRLLSIYDVLELVSEKLTALARALEKCQQGAEKLAELTGRLSESPLKEKAPAKTEGKDIQIGDAS